MLRNKIVNLRKNKGFSQEDLAVKIGVTRQTISNWETGQTVPDVGQAKLLSNVFGVSLDELLDNDIQNIVIEKVSNTEKLAGLIIKILKAIGILILIFFILNIIALILFTVVRRESESSVVLSATLSCSIEKNDYDISIGSDGYFNCSNCTHQMQARLKDITDFADIEYSIDSIESYFKKNGGSCKDKRIS